MNYQRQLSTVAVLPARNEWHYVNVVFGVTSAICLTDMRGLLNVLTMRHLPPTSLAHEFSAEQGRHLQQWGLLHSISVTSHLMTEL